MFAGTNKQPKRRNPVAFDLLLSGTYNQRKEENRKRFKRKFRNDKEMNREQEIYG